MEPRGAGRWKREDRTAGKKPVRVPQGMDGREKRTPRAEDATSAIRSRWSWAEPTVWMERMLTALEEGVKGGRWHCLGDKPLAVAEHLLCRTRALLSNGRPCGGQSIRSAVNHRPESQMREIRKSGSEGGRRKSMRLSYPYRNTKNCHGPSPLRRQGSRNSSPFFNGLLDFTGCNWRLNLPASPQ